MAKIKFKITKYKKEQPVAVRVFSHGEGKPLALRYPEGAKGRGWGEVGDVELAVQELGKVDDQTYVEVEVRTLRGVQYHQHEAGKDMVITELTCKVEEKHLLKVDTKETKKAPESGKPRKSPRP